MGMPRRIGIAAIVLAVAVAAGVALTRNSAALPVADGSFSAVWRYTDGPVAFHGVSRTWIWGPEAMSPVVEEPYADAPGGRRQVQYFDKARMEQAVEPAAGWAVTNGLLASELVTGRLQLGDDVYESHDPATINVAGDPGDSPAPTYATFRDHLGDPPTSVGSPVVQVIHRDGSAEVHGELAGYGVTAGVLVPETNHTVASVFWTFMTSAGPVEIDGELRTGALFENPFYAVGFPITEPFWSEVTVAGTQQWVLIQVFERRVLTFTPGNPAGWQVESGNVGSHYRSWRAGLSAAEPADTAGPPDPDGPQGCGQQTTVSDGGTVSQTNSATIVQDGSGTSSVTCEQVNVTIQGP